jgi:hypothetical protein
LERKSSLTVFSYAQRRQADGRTSFPGGLQW